MLIRSNIVPSFFVFTDILYNITECLRCGAMRCRLQYCFLHFYKQWICVNFWGEVSRENNVRVICNLTSNVFHYIFQVRGKRLRVARYPMKSVRLLQTVQLAIFFLMHCTRPKSEFSTSYIARHLEGGMSRLVRILTKLRMIPSRDIYEGRPTY